MSEAALTALQRGAAPVVPPLWMYEVVNVLALARRKGVMDRATAATFWSLTAYDAAYLELALRESLPLATLDAGLKRAARGAGARLFASGIG